MPVSPDFTAYNVRMAQLAQLRSQALPLNKDVLFDALVTAGIAKVVVQFDGSGDSGQIEGIAACNADGDAVDLPKATITFHDTNSSTMSLVARQDSPANVIETMTYDLLGQKHGSWGNDDGAYGDMTFDAGDRSITLDYNERFTQTTSYVDTF
jgi:hypothetical protein